MILQAVSALWPLLLWPASGTWAGGSMEEQDWVTVARCRAGCVRDTVGAAMADTCHTHRQCNMCWTVCERLLADTMSWAPVCDHTDNPKLCPLGCRTACNFLFTASLRQFSPDFSTWSFPSLASATIMDEATVTLTWLTPIRSSAPTLQTEALVYNTYWRDRLTGPAWQLFISTIGHVATMNGLHQQHAHLEFKVTAVSPEGVVAETFPPYPGPPATHSDSLTNSEATSHPTLTSTPPLNLHEAPTMTLTLSVDLVTSEDGVLECRVQWEGSVQPEDYVIRWERQQCQDCARPRQRLATVVHSQDKVTILTLPGVTYNSKYWVEVEAEGWQSGRVYFYTPVCLTSVTGNPQSACVPLQTSGLTPVSSTKGPLEPSPYRLSFQLAVCASAVLVLIVVVLVIVLLHAHDKLHTMLVSKMAAFRKLRRNLSRSLSRVSSGHGGSLKRVTPRTSSLLVSTDKGSAFIDDLPIVVERKPGSAQPVVLSPIYKRPPVLPRALPSTPTQTTPPSPSVFVQAD